MGRSCATPRCSLQHLRLEYCFPEGSEPLRSQRHDRQTPFSALTTRSKPRTPSLAAPCGVGSLLLIPHCFHRVRRPHAVQPRHLTEKRRAGCTDHAWNCRRVALAVGQSDSTSALRRLSRVCRLTRGIRSREPVSRISSHGPNSQFSKFCFSDPDSRLARQETSADQETRETGRAFALIRSAHSSRCSLQSANPTRPTPQVQFRNCESSREVELLKSRRECQCDSDCRLETLQLPALCSVAEHHHQLPHGLLKLPSVTSRQRCKGREAVFDAEAVHACAA